MSLNLQYSKGTHYQLLWTAAPKYTRLIDNHSIKMKSQNMISTIKERKLYLGNQEKLLWESDIWAESWNMNRN